MLKTDTPILFRMIFTLIKVYKTLTAGRRLVPALLTTNLLFLFVTITFAQQPECALTCVSNLNVSLDANCEAKITVDMVLQNLWSPLCAPNGPQAFQVFVMKNGQVIPTSPIVTLEYLGQTLQVKVKHWKTGNTCWSDIYIQDKMAPVIKCPPNITITCNEPSDTSHTGKATASDCSGYIINFTDVYTGYGCNNPAGKIVRTWTATDGNGMKSSCTQTITIKKSTIADVVFPKNLDGLQLPALDCSASNTNPSVTGYPLIGNYPVINNNNCMVSFTYSDQTINLCSGSKKILRSWTAVDWCSSQIKTNVQIIKVDDKTPPVISCQGIISGNTYSDQCKGAAIIPAAIITDNCSNYTVHVNASWGDHIQGNGGIFYDIPIGSYTITYYATDDCGNIGSCTAVLIIKDNSPPTVVCTSFINVSLGGDGNAKVSAKTFDDGSTDNCCIGSYLVKRMEQSDSSFASTINFTCADAGKTILVVLKVTDCSGNSNSCMVQVLVQDKIPPLILCPPDVTASCGVDVNNLSVFGTATAYDNCGIVTITETNNVQLSSCATGVIKRVFTATGADGKTAQCTQLITVINNNTFTLADITWPKDYEAMGCTALTDLEPDALAAPYNKPILNPNKCSFVGIAHTDEVFSIAAPACFKILRKWKIIDWCQYIPNVPNSPGYWEYTQLIKVFDFEKPKLNCPADITVSSTILDCTGAQVDLPLVTATDCNPNITISNSYNSGGANASGFYPLGTTTVIFSATDGCKNTATCAIHIVVIDGKKPTPYCLNGLSVSIMPSTLSVTIWAKDFISKGVDNCTPESKLKYTIKKVNSVTPLPPTDSSIEFTCNDLGTQAVEVWACDESGNCDFCTTYIIVQDNMKSCPPSSGGNILIAGKVANEKGASVESVTLNIPGLNINPLVTGSNGAWTFTNLPKGQSYLIVPEKDINAGNGVSTVDLLLIQKHILGVKELDSPYKLIAADIDKNGVITTKDLIDLRRLILQVYTKFPSNTSWRFLDGSYKFPNPKNPFCNTLPENLYYNKLNNDMLGLNIMGIKIGDVDGSAKASNFSGNNEIRTGGTELSLYLTDHEFVKDELIDIPVSLNIAKAINTLQFSLQYNKELLDFKGIKEVKLNDWEEDFLNANQEKEGLLSLAWSSVEPYISDGNAFLHLEFTAKAKGILSNSLQLNDKLTEALAYEEKEGISEPVLHFSKGNENDMVVLYPNQPNPFKQQTMIKFYVSYETEISLNIYDLAGRLIVHKEGNYEKGQHLIPISKQELGQGGMYIYEIVTPRERVTDKMIMAD